MIHIIWIYIFSIFSFHPSSQSLVILITLKTLVVLSKLLFSCIIYILLFLLIMMCVCVCVCWFHSVNEGSHSASHRPQYTSIINAASSIFRQNGVRGLYQGVTPNLWGAGASWGLYFLVYVITSCFLLVYQGTVQFWFCTWLLHI